VARAPEVLDRVLVNDPRGVAFAAARVLGRGRGEAAGPDARRVRPPGQLRTGQQQLERLRITGGREDRAAGAADGGLDAEVPRGSGRGGLVEQRQDRDRKSTRLNSS